MTYMKTADIHLKTNFSAASAATTRANTFYVSSIVE